MVSIRGIPFELHPQGEMFSDAIRRDEDFFEAEILDYIADNYPVHGTIVDIGANIGNHSLFFCNKLQYRQILAFEPVPDNYILLTINCARYRGFYPFKFALDSHIGLVNIAPQHSNMGASFVSPEGTIEVVAIPLDLFSLYDCTLIKIDVELYEPEVLRGAYLTISKNRPLILIEDANQEYGHLLPDYKMIKAWPEHKTYLYGWNP